MRKEKEAPQKKENITVLLGKTGSGKTTALASYAKKKFIDHIEKTMAARPTQVPLATDNKDKAQTIIDTSGAEHFRRTLEPSLLSATLVAVFIDLTDIASSIDYLELFKGKISESARLIVIFSKSDLISAKDDRPSVSDVKSLIAEKLDVTTKRFRGHYFVSAKSTASLNGVFEKLHEITNKKLAPAFHLRLGSGPRLSTQSRGESSKPAGHSRVSINL